MLHVTVNGETFKYEADRMMLSEGIALQKVTGMTVTEWTKGLQDGDLTAMQGLVWLMYRRAGRTTAWDDIDFDLGSLDVTDDEDEQAPDPIGAAEAPPVAEQAMI